jgi:hypothetical protein
MSACALDASIECSERQRACQTAPSKVFPVGVYCEGAQARPPPQAARALANGETVWRYESYQGDLLCLEYMLRFDQAKILRQWTRQCC